MNTTPGMAGPGARWGRIVNILRVMFATLAAADLACAVIVAHAWWIGSMTPGQ